MLHCEGCCIVDEEYSSPVVKVFQTSGETFTEYHEAGIGKGLPSERIEKERKEQETCS
jgi:hypothetical protein